ncbi:Nucleic-acid-binding protein transposon like protein [Argiope bruennichi]|uniref:Nucleic-acid-binding protein transposon like protein n=1 Tax=Argiope bruennichi TaxID=94029 RepID=A0A8T0FM52_ARGBR|nr:Nucleic-acid-binding protein transposon like protein [Argiope bruennichi]
MEFQQCQGHFNEVDSRSEENSTVPRPISPASIQVTEEFIAEHSLEITQAISLKENLGNWAQALAAAKDQGQHLQVKREIQQVSGCLNQLLIKLGIPLFKLPENVRKLNFICEKVRMKNIPRAASNVEAKNVNSNDKPNVNVKAAPRRKIDLSGNKNKNVCSPKGSPIKESKKRVADEDGFIAPAAHLVRKNKNLKVTKENKEIEIQKVPEGLEEVALDDVVDAEPSPAQPKQRRVPPFFVTPRADFRTMLNILKLEAPSLRSVMSNRFLKLTVETEEEHRSLSHLLESQGAEFKTFMLKTDRPIKVVIRGLPFCTPIEKIKAEFQKEGFSVVSITQLTKFQTKLPIPLFYVQIENGPLSETVYTLTEMFGTKISVERYRGRKGPSQCWRCQGFFHSSEACKLPINRIEDKRPSSLGASLKPHLIGIGSTPNSSSDEEMDLAEAIKDQTQQPNVDDARPSTPENSPRPISPSSIQVSEEFE